MRLTVSKERLGEGVAFARLLHMFLPPRVFVQNCSNTDRPGIKAVVTRHWIPAAILAMLKKNW